MREKILFDAAWHFHRGDIDTSYGPTKPIAYRSAKTDRAQTGPAAASYNVGDDWWTTKGVLTRERWDIVDLPHDYMLGDEPQEDQNEGLGFLRYDNAWYRKTFRLEKSDAGRRISFLFDGVATHATVYVNGCLMKRNFCGYTGFEVDVSDVVRYDDDNVIAVYVSTAEHEGWWYEGAGIYRHVWLIKTEPLCIDLWGVFAKPARNDHGVWTVQTEVTVRNDGDTRKTARLFGKIYDGDKCIASAETVGNVTPRGLRTFTYSFTVADPRLWSPESPHLYTMRTTLSQGDTPIDENAIRFGFRTFRADAETGFYINDKPYKIKGLCAHEVTGLTGKAVPDNVQRYRVRLMKEMGANGYRTSHYPQSEALMDALDEAGFIVMDETRWFESTDEGRAQLEMLIKRDRNHPSVFFWSLGNEEPLHVTDVGRRIYRSLAAFTRQLDDSRIILTAVTHRPNGPSVLDDSDVVALNYKWDEYAVLRKRFPNKPFLSSECCATGTTRGWYFPSDPSLGVLSAYDADTSGTFMGREFVWNFIDSRPWVMGGYQWAAFEHKGEAKWPRLCSVSGAIDLFFQKKDAFWQNLSHWSDTPMVHLLPHWNFAGMEGYPIRVCAYTNASRLELFLNGKDMGVCEIVGHGHGEWQVPYAPGRLEVRAYNGNELVATDVCETTGAAHRLALRLETSDLLPGDVAILTCLALDRDGKEVPDASPTVRFSACGGGSLFSTGSSNCDHVSVFSPERRMWMGRIGVAVKLDAGSSHCTVYAQADGLDGAVLVI